MNTAPRHGSRVAAAAALVPATLAVLLTGWSLGRPGSPAGPAGPAGPRAAGLPATVGSVSPPVSAPPGDSPAGPARVALRVPGGAATATLASTPVARDFAAQLPLRLSLTDPMGQAKSGPLPRRLDVSGAERVLRPRVGNLYYWPPSGDLAIVYDDLGQSVPPPGLVRLGTVDAGLESIASAGNRFTLSVDRL